MKYILLLLLLFIGCGRTGDVGFIKNSTYYKKLELLIRKETMPECKGGSGVTVLEGIDYNKNGILEVMEGEVTTSTFICDGKDGESGEDGDDGVDGKDGIDGKDGEDGIDGEDGKDGEDAPVSEFDVTQVIDPCGDSGGKDEVLLLLKNGDILAYYEEGGKRFLTLLVDGTYRTTDSQKCQFHIIDGEYQEG